MEKSILISFLTATTIFSSLLTSERRNSIASFYSTGSLDSENHQLCTDAELAIPDEPGISALIQSRAQKSLCSSDRVIRVLKTKTDKDLIRESIEFICKNELDQLNHLLGIHNILLSRPEIMMTAVTKRNTQALRIFFSQLEDIRKPNDYDQDSKRNTAFRILAPHIKSILEYAKTGKKHLLESKKLESYLRCSSKTKYRLLQDINRRRIFEIEQKIREIGASQEQVELAKFIEESGLENRLRTIVLIHSNNT